MRTPGPGPRWSSTRGACTAGPTFPENAALHRPPRRDGLERGASRAGAARHSFERNRPEAGAGGWIGAQRGALRRNLLERPGARAADGGTDFELSINENSRRKKPERTTLWDFRAPDLRRGAEKISGGLRALR